MTAMIPMVETPGDARDLLTAMTSDPRIRALSEHFTTGFPAVVEHLQKVKATLPTSEQAQAQVVESRWRNAAEVPGRLPDEPGPALVWLTSLASTRWDLRAGAERDAIPTSAELLPDDVCDLVYGLAQDWGMRSPRLAVGEFDGVVVLGGLVRANLNRPQAAADALASGDVSASYVVGLTGDRPLSDVEMDLASQMGLEGRNEQDSMAEGFGRAFGLAQDDWIQSIEYGRPVRRYRLASGTELLIVLAPPRDDEGKQRASTESSFGWFARTSGLVDESSGLLVITTPIYWIQNHIDVLTKLAGAGSAARAITAGGTAEVMPPDLVQHYRSQHYLQEIKSAFDAVPRLLNWAGIEAG
jgi:hypothetical protein